MGLKSWAKNKAKQAKKKADQAKHKAEEAAKAAKRKAEEAKKLAERKAQEAKKKAKQLADKAAEELTVNLISRIEEVAKSGEKQIEAAVKSAASEVEKTVKDRIPELMEEALVDMVEVANKDAAKKALGIACDIIETTSPSSYTLILGIELALVVQGEVTVAMEIPNPVSKISKIKAWAKKPPKGRKKIIECVKDFAPSSLTVEAKISGNGGSANYDGEHIYDNVDKFLQKFGVK